MSNKKEDTPISLGEAVSIGLESGSEFNKRVKAQRRQVAERLKKLREEKKLTQSELCRAIEVNRITYANYETERAEPSIYVLVRLACFYDVSLDYLCCRTSKRLGYYSEGDERQHEIAKLYNQMTELQSKIEQLENDNDQK